MSGTVPAPAPVLSSANVAGAPASTLAGVGLALGAIGPVLAAAQTPTNAVGWASLGLQLLMGVLAVFARA